MGIWDWLFSDIPDSLNEESYHRSSFSSTRIVCKPDQNGETKCTKYTTRRSSDPNHPSQDQVIQEDVPFESVHISPFQDLDDIMQDFFDSSRFGDVFRQPRPTQDFPDSTRGPFGNRGMPGFDANLPQFGRWGGGNGNYRSERGTDVYDI